MVYFEVPTEVGNQIDFVEGGPGPLIGHMMERFTPEAVYSVAGERAVFMVADLDAAQMMEIMLLVSKKLGTYPEFTPVLTAEETLGFATKAIEEAKKVP
jgi:hypothetical protein